MDNGLTRLLFEDMPLLLLAEVAAIAVVLGVHRRWMTTRSRRMVWMTLAICGVLIVVQRWVVTDREAIRQTIETMAGDVNEGDVASLGKNFDDRIVLGGIRGKEAVLKYAYLMLQQYDVNNARVSGFRIDLMGGQATITFQAVADIRGGPAESYRTPLKWKMTMTRTDAGWKVLRAEYELGLAGLGG